MSTAPGTVAKAFLDALPTLDYNKLVTEARRQLGIVVVGDRDVAERIIAQFRIETDLPGDARLAIWRHEKDVPGPLPSGKAELVIVAPCTESFMRQARETFSGVALLPIRYGDETASEGTADAISLPDLEPRTIQASLIGPVVDRLWERRLALGRGAPGTRELIARRLTHAAARDVKVLLGSVAGAGSGRNGAPTAATAQLLLHQGALIVSLAAIFGEPLDDKRAIFARVAPNLAPTLLLDGAEAGLSRLAASMGKDSKYGKLFGPMAAYVARPTLSASSTLLAGTTARRVFRPGPRTPSLLQRTRAVGKQVALGVGQGVAVATGLVGMRMKLKRDEALASSNSAEPGLGEDTPPSAMAAQRVDSETTHGGTGDDGELDRSRDA